MTTISSPVGAASHSYDSTSVLNCLLVTASMARSTVVAARKSWMVWSTRSTTRGRLREPGFDRVGRCRRVSLMTREARTLW